mgnify:CR=1 FL=1
MPDTKDISDQTTPPNGVNGDAHIITLGDMYQDYFLDYASYVILERAVPGIVDGLKPVQRRLLHALARSRSELRAPCSRFQPTPSREWSRARCRRRFAPTRPLRR